MEHLTRNTNNDRIIYTIENIKESNTDVLRDELTRLSEKVVTVFTGILSSIVSSGIIGIIKGQEDISLNVVVYVILFLFMLICFWFICLKWVIPRLVKIFSNPKIKLDPDNEIIAVKKYNTEIMQKVAEINEIVDVISQTDITECKILNYVMALYKLQEIVDFLHENLMENKNISIRKNNNGMASLLRYSFNEYSVLAVLKTVRHIRDKMKDLLKDDDISDLDINYLLSNDLKSISNKLDKINVV